MSIVSCADNPLTSALAQWADPLGPARLTCAYLVAGAGFEPATFGL
jgi:hypothetical protein